MRVAMKIEKSQGQIIPFPGQHSEEVANRVRREMLMLQDSSNMLDYIQTEIPKIHNFFTDIILDVVNRNRGLFTVYVVSDYPGFPMTVQSECLRSALVGCALELCAQKPPTHKTSRALIGISPVYVKPIKKFRGEL